MLRDWTSLDTYGFRALVLKNQREIGEIIVNKEKFTDGKDGFIFYKILEFAVVKSSQCGVENERENFKQHAVDPMLIPFVKNFPRPRVRAAALALTTSGLKKSAQG
jgi:hypothetical protein